MGRRRRKGRPPATAPTPAPVSPRASRSAARDEAVRARLTPLGERERPAALVIASILAAVLATANLAAFAAGVEVDGRRPGILGVLVFCGLMGIIAWGMWARRYWAVLGFETLLGVTVAIASLSILLASNLFAVALCLVTIGLGGWLFWKLVRVMARLQAPQRRPSDSG